MSAIATAIVGSAVVGGAVANRSARRAAGEQRRSTDAAIDEEARQFDAIVELLAPYVEQGRSAMGAQGALLGLEGPEAQRDAILAIEQSPEFTSLIEQGEEGILQNAAATGGLRGGNVQEALAQFRPQVLSSLINQRFGRLQQVAGLGQASAAGQAAAAQNSQIPQLLQERGAIAAGQQLAQGQAIGNIVQSVPTALIAAKSF